jgi:DNA primase
MGKRKLESQKQNQSLSCCYLSQEQGDYLNTVTGNGYILPYSQIIRQAVEELPLYWEDIQSPAMAESYPYRLGSSLLTGAQKAYLDRYMEMTGRKRSQCVRDAIQALMVRNQKP